MEAGSSQDLTVDPISKHEPQHSDMQYDEAFPALGLNGGSGSGGGGSGQTSGLSSPGAPSKWSQKMRIGSNVVTSVFNIPFEERSDRGHGERFGEMDSLKVCAEITKQTGAHIEMSSSARDQSLTFLVTGKQANVLNAKREILSRFQTQAQMSINIPKEHHRFLLGAKGSLLAELEKSTGTKISIPRPAEDSTVVTIVGAREGLEKAVHEIRLISDRQSKQASERLTIPKKFHPFIQGPSGDRVRELESEHGVKINIPPPSVQKDDIHISGEKEGVAAVVSLFNKEHADYKRYSSVQMEVSKGQHKYVIGMRRSGISDILARTGVSVEVPPGESGSETITLLGPGENLGTALSLVHEKANSVVTRTIPAPGWIHKYIVGKKGANIRNITASYPKAHVEIKENEIVIEGPADEVNGVTSELETCVADLLNTKSFKEIQIDTKYHKYIIGKGGVNVNRLRDETGVLISLKDTSSSTIVLEGSSAGVELAAERLLEQVAKIQNETERELPIEHRFHGNLIGSKGEKIRDIRDKFNQVQVSFPPSSECRDIVTVRGPKADVDACSTYLLSLHSDLLATNFQLKVPVFPQSYRLLLGRSNSNIRDIREETGVRIELPQAPSEERRNRSEAEVIVLTGKKEACEKARERILELQKSLADVVEVDVLIPNKFHNTLIGAGGKNVHAISEDCGGVQINFPDPKSKSDRITLIGHKEDVEKAKQMMLEDSREREQNSFTESLDVNAQQYKYLAGKNYSNVRRRIREKTGAYVNIPAEGEPNPYHITFTGKKDGVKDAKKLLQEMLKELENVTEIEMDVDPQWHRHFVIRRGEVINKISDELGDVQISFPKIGSNSSRVYIKGSPGSVERAKERVLFEVDELVSRVSLPVTIEQRHHRTILGSKGAKVQKIQATYHVDIKFPERANYNNSNNTNNGGDYAHGGENNEGESEESATTNSYADTIMVSGRKENCEGAIKALLEQVPVEDEVDIPYDMHRFIIGSKGKDVRDMMHTYDVNIVVPPQDNHSDTIIIIGSPKNVKEAKEALLAKRDELEEEKKVKELKSYTVSVKVDPEYHPKIIGRKGATINAIRDKFDVSINLPQKSDNNGGEGDVNEEDSIITISGFEDKANAARDEILKIVNEYVDMVKEDVEIDHRVHSRIIGSKGKNVRQIMQDFKVDIRFPRDSNSNIVTISGSDADRIYDARDHLLNLEEEYLQDVSETEYMRQFVRGSGGGGGGGRDGERGGGKGGRGSGGEKNGGFVVKGAPWEAPPDTQSNEEFPSMGNGVSNSRPISSAWGARKHF